MDIDRSGGFNYDLFYNDIIERFISGNFIEIGVYKGGSLSYMAEQIKLKNKKIHLYGVDNFSECYLDTNKTCEDVKQLCMNRLSEYDNVTLIVKNSIDAALLFPDAFFEFIFIDAAHDYDNVKQDILTWLPKLKPNIGVIAGHDYNETFFGVPKAVNEIFGDKVINIGPCWMI